MPLVLGRYTDERVRIRTTDGDIWVRVIDVNHSQVKLDFDAPREIQIAREEVLPPDEQREPVEVEKRRLRREAFRRAAIRARNE